MFMQRTCYSHKWNAVWCNTKLIYWFLWHTEPKTVKRELTVMAINHIACTHLVYSTLVYVGAFCIEMVFPITEIVRARLLQLHVHIKKDRKWNVNSKCNTFLIYVLHLLRQLPGCSWKKNDLFINQVHYFSSLEKEKNVFIIFSCPHINQQDIFCIYLNTYSFINSFTINSWAPTMCWLQWEYWG